MVYALSFTSGLMILSHRKVRSSEQIPELDTMVLMLVERMNAVQLAALPVTIGAIVAVAI